MVSLEDVLKSGSDIRVSFGLPTPGLVFVHFKVRIGRVFTACNVSTACLQRIFRGSATRVPKFIVDFVCAMRLLTLILPCLRQVTENAMR